jgi:vacuolar-type H+-ATPase subunit H
MKRHNPTMQSSTNGVGLSPLERIRQAEAEVTRRLAVARESAEKTVAAAQEEVIKIKAQASAEGQRNGEAKFREIISKAEEESRAIVTRRTTVQINYAAKASAAWIRLCALLSCAWSVLRKTMKKRIRTNEHRDGTHRDCGIEDRPELNPSHSA